MGSVTLWAWLPRSNKNPGYATERDLIIVTRSGGMPYFISTCHRASKPPHSGDQFDDLFSLGINSGLIIIKIWLTIQIYHNACFCIAGCLLSYNRILATCWLSVNHLTLSFLNLQQGIPVPSTLILNYPTYTHVQHSNEILCTQTSVLQIKFTKHSNV